MNPPHRRWKKEKLPNEELETRCGENPWTPEQYRYRMLSPREAEAAHDWARRNRLMGALWPTEIEEPADNQSRLLAVGSALFAIGTIYGFVCGLAVVWLTRL